MVPAAERDLCVRHNGSDEYHGGNDVTSSWIVFAHAQCRCKDERDGYDGPDHREVMLQNVNK